MGENKWKTLKKETNNKTPQIIPLGFPGAIYNAWVHVSI